MSVTMTFPNFAVEDVAVATAFYEALGFAKNPMFSDEHTACIVVSDQVAIMLLEHDKFDSFLIDGQTRASRGHVETLTAVLLDSTDAVDAFALAGASNGGTLTKPVTQQEYGMYGGQLTDPDGHVLDFFFMESPEG